MSFDQGMRARQAPFTLKSLVALHCFIAFFNRESATSCAETEEGSGVSYGLQPDKPVYVFRHTSATCCACAERLRRTALMSNQITYLSAHLSFFFWHVAILPSAFFVTAGLFTIVYGFRRQWLILLVWRFPCQAMQLATKGCLFMDLQWTVVGNWALVYCVIL